MTNLRGRSVYLTVKQWEALSDYITDDLLHQIRCTSKAEVSEELISALNKLQRIGDEVVAAAAEEVK